MANQPKKLPWFRLYTETIDDEKLRLLAFEDRWHFIAILCLKGQGILDEKGPLLMRKVAVKMGVDLRTLEEILRRLDEVGLVDEKTLEPVNWGERQYRSDSSTARVSAYRERMKQNMKRYGNVTVTAQDTDTDKDKEKNKEKKKDENLSAQARNFSVSDLVEKGVSEQVATEFLQVRKNRRAPLTEIAFKGLVRESNKAGVNLNHALTICIERGWQSFKADWVKADLSRPDENIFKGVAL